MEVMAPWLPLEASQTEAGVEIRAWGRVYRQENAYFPTSIESQGRELLYAPARLVGEANGEPIHWEDAGCYLLNPTDASACINGYAQSQCLIVNSCLQMDFDGGARWDVRVMPRGKTVPQVFGLEPCPIRGWELTKLYLEIPLRRESAKLYCSWRDAWDGNNGLYTRGGERLAENGAIPSGGFVAPFLPALWVGDERVGLQLTAESDEYWQSAAAERAMEIIDAGDHWVLRCNLLESLPDCWEQPDASCPVISYSFGLIATPVKPFTNDHLKIKAVRIDCFARITGEYSPSLQAPVEEGSTESVIDRLCRAGVNTLILHEKWNKIQNNWNVPVSTEREIRQLVSLCHSRGMRVIPYFGYEITSSMPEYTQVRDEVIWRGPRGRENYSGWYRVPYQRAARVCQESRWMEPFLEGMMACVERFHFDGVYLDSTSAPSGCVNERHGCGYVGRDGRRHPTYPIFATREVFKRIYARIHARGGLVNPHPAGATIPFITSFCDMLWDGEHIQTRIRDEGLKNFSLDYFRAEYLGRNFGIPVQFIVYEFPGVWDFDMALSLSLLHGVYPRPNSVLHPLDVMEKIWGIVETFGICEAGFAGYWENAAAIRLSNASVKASYYERKQVDGSVRLLVVVSNPTIEAAEACTLRIESAYFGQERVAQVYDALENRFALAQVGETAFSLAPYAYKIYEIVLSSER